MAVMSTKNLDKFSEAMKTSDKDGIMSALTHDFGGRENARVAMAYMSAVNKIAKLDAKVRVLLAFVSGVAIGSSVSAAIAMVL